MNTRNKDEMHDITMIIGWRRRPSVALYLFCCIIRNFIDFFEVVRRHSSSNRTKPATDRLIIIISYKLLRNSITIIITCDAKNK